MMFSMDAKIMRMRWRQFRSCSPPYNYFIYISTALTLLMIFRYIYQGHPSSVLTSYDNNTGAYLRGDSRISAAMSYRTAVLKSISQHEDTIKKTRAPIIPSPPSDHELPYDNLLNVVEKWNPDDPEIPADFKEVLQQFNYSNPVERAMAEKYRNAEIPFKMVLESLRTFYFDLNH